VSDRDRVPGAPALAAGRSGPSLEGGGSAPRVADAPLRVLALSDHLGHPDGRVHGGTTYFVTTYPAIREAGVDLKVAFMAPPHPAAEGLREHGIEPVFLGRSKWDMRACFDVARLIREHRSQVLHLASFKSQFLGRLIAPRFGCRSIIHLHDTVPLGPVVGPLQRSVRKRTDLALAVSDAVGELGVNEYGLPREKVLTLHNGIDVDAFGLPRPAARGNLLGELGLQEPVRLLGIIGRFAEMKGQRYAIEAMQTVREACPEVRLLLIGEGDLRPECERLARDLGVGDVVLFLGQRPDVPDLLAALDAVVMPSISGEGLPYAAIEAISAGRPIVAFPTAGIPDIVVPDRSGLLAEHGDVASLAAAITRLLTEPGLLERLHEGALEHAQRFTLRSHVDYLISLYHEVSGRPAGPRPA
jgi:L-malate glycosyltransferase